MASSHPITTPTEPDRRALVLWAFSAPVLASAPGAAAATPQPTISDAWRAFIRTVAAMHPDGAKAAVRAYLDGASLDQLARITIDGPPTLTGGYPLLQFATESGWLYVHPDATWVLDVRGRARQ